MNKVIIVQARMTSTRLPGKILKEVLGKPLLQYQLERLLRVKLADAVVIATTQNETDQPVVELCSKLKVPVFRGPEEDVLARYYGAALEHKAEAVIRVTSDCPLIDPEIVDQVIAAYCDMYPRYDYVSNCLVRSYPRGMDTEVFSFRALNEAFLEAKEQGEHEHVTPFIYRRPDRYKLFDVVSAVDESDQRWTVDTPEDYILIKNIISALYPVKPEFTMADCLTLMREHPDWRNINAHIEQKKV